METQYKCNRVVYSRGTSNYSSEEPEFYAFSFGKISTRQPARLQSERRFTRLCSESTTISEPRRNLYCSAVCRWRNPHKNFRSNGNGIAGSCFVDCRRGNHGNSSRRTFHCKQQR